MLTALLIGRVTLFQVPFILWNQNGVAEHQRSKQEGVLSSSGIASTFFHISLARASHMGPKQTFQWENW